MASKTISHCQGKGSLSHNNRTFKPKNVDSSRSSDNITFVKMPISQAYDECFTAAVERYNAKQKRADRRIKDGYFRYAFSHEPCNNVITASDKRKSFYEDVVQIGCKDDTGVGSPDAILAAECLKEYMRSFQKRNPNFFVFNAVLHMDEATPHLHIDYIPIGHYKRGVDTQNGLAQALKEMGYGEGENTISRWRTAECEVLTEICARHEIEISEPQKGRGYTYTVEQYKQHKDTISELEHRTEELSENLDELKRLNEAAETAGIESTKLPLRKRIVSEDEFVKLEAARKTAAVRETKIADKETELKQRESAIAEKETDLFQRIAEADKSFDKYNALADELIDESLAYHKLLPQHEALQKRCKNAESELSQTQNALAEEQRKTEAAVGHIVNIALMSNSLLAKPSDAYADLSEQATPRHKLLANAIRYLCSRFVKALGFDTASDEILHKAEFTKETEAEFKRLEHKQNKRGIDR